MNKLRADLLEARRLSNNRPRPVEQQRIVLTPSKTGIIKPIADEVFRSPPRKRRKSKPRGRVARRIDDMICSEDEEDSSEDEPKSWKPDWLSELGDVKMATDVEHVIESIKGHDQEDGKEAKKLVWDHGATPKGAKSDENFLKWMRAYSAHESKKQMKTDDLIFQ